MSGKGYGIRNIHDPRMINVYTIQIFKWEWIRFECEIQNNSRISLNWFCYRLSNAECRMPNAIQNLKTSFLFLEYLPSWLHFFFKFNAQYAFLRLDGNPNVTRLLSTEKRPMKKKNIEEFYFDSKFGMYTDLWSNRREYRDWKKKAKKTVFISTLK